MVQAPRVIVIADRTIMGSDKCKSKKRARLTAFQDDAVVEESRATKVSKKEFPATKVVYNPSSVKEQYDNAYPPHLIVHEDEPSYIMAHNYIKAYGICPVSMASHSC